MGGVGFQPIVQNSPDSPLGRPPPQLAGTWEIGLLGMICLLFAVGAAINPAFFGSGDALHALLRDSSRVAVMAVGMTFVIANRDLDLSVGSTLGLTAVVFSLAFDPHRLDLEIGPAVATDRCGRHDHRNRQRCAGHPASRSRVHCDADDAPRRSRDCSRPDRRTLCPLFAQGRGVPRLLSIRRNQPLGVQQPDRHRGPLCRRRRRRAGQDPMGLRNAGHRRQRAGSVLRRHSDGMGPHPGVRPLLLVRDPGGPDDRRAGQRRHRAGRLC